MPNTTIRPLTYGDHTTSPRFSVEKFERMFEVGVFDATDRVELLEGYIFNRSSQDNEHDRCAGSASNVIKCQLPMGWAIQLQETLNLSDSQLDPDIAIVRAREQANSHHRTVGSDVGLLAEVAFSSLLRDTQNKSRIYARAGIPVYWVIDVTNKRIIVHAQPSGPTAAPTYADVRAICPPERAPLVLDGVTVATIPANDLLP